MKQQSLEIEKLNKNKDIKYGNKTVLRKPCANMILTNMHSHHSLHSCALLADWLDLNRRPRETLTLSKSMVVM